MSTGLHIVNWRHLHLSRRFYMEEMGKDLVKEEYRRQYRSQKGGLKPWQKEVLVSDKEDRLGDKWWEIMNHHLTQLSHSLAYTQRT